MMQQPLSKKQLKSSRFYCEVIRQKNQNIGRINSNEKWRQKVFKKRREMQEMLKARKAAPKVSIPPIEVIQRRPEERTKQPKWWQRLFFKKKAA